MLIYKITNIINSKIYIGQTIRTLDIRINEHLKDSNKNNYPLYRAIRKYGWNNFKVEIIDVDTTQEELNSKEIYWIKEFNCIVPNGYNIKGGGSNGKHHEETKAKLRLAHIGKHHTEESKAKMSKAWEGRIVSEETKAKMRLATTGKHLSEEAKAKISALQIGRKLTEETKAKMRLAKTGKKRSEETKKKISLTQQLRHNKEKYILDYQI